MARCRLSDKSIRRLLRKYPIISNITPGVVAALVHGDTDHRIDLLLVNGDIAYLYKSGALELASWDKGNILTHRFKGPIITL